MNERETKQKYTKKTRKNEKRTIKTSKKTKKDLIKLKKKLKKQKQLATTRALALIVSQNQIYPY
tara:strand:+ start:1938 stop:2129 length:192 start_codon:yes stop_codon:yes gene_type:complete